MQGLRKAGLIVAMAAGALAGGCASGGEAKSPTFSATIFQTMDADLPRDRARRDSLAFAENQARERIREQIYQMKLSDGRNLGDLSAIDPFVRAVVQDNLRAAQIADRTVNKEGVVSVTVEMDLAPLYKMIEQYSAHAI